MKKQFYLFFLLLVQEICIGQGLVPNGDFESYTSCPNGWSWTIQCAPWIIPTTGTADYFNSCAPQGQLSTPSNVFGYQQARSGSGYCGIVFCADNYREYLEVPLLDSLVPNFCYKIELYLSLCEMNIEYSSNKIGAYFSDTLFTDPISNGPIQVTPQVILTTSVPHVDTSGWTRMTGIFTATGHERYLIIGDFSPANTAPIIQLGQQSMSSPVIYFYIDDVSLENISCVTNVASIANEEINLYPNPFRERISISIDNNHENVINLFDLTGRKILTRTFINSTFINTENVPNGIYFYEICKNNESHKKGILVKN
ncbi:MAG: T9SS type A sorting domain-containing protein [Bacteroidetes bacterium]|nr:MAG: T9SS type A sorting domain-containing protein [Bacteroidota bacterium]